MLIFAFDSRRIVNNEAELERALRELVSQGFPSFFLSEGDGDYPVLSIAVNGVLATLIYLLQDNDPGWRSLGNILSQEEESLFGYQGYVMNEPVPNRFVISFDQAVIAAKEFLHDKKLPPSIKWLDL